MSPDSNDLYSFGGLKATDTTEGNYFRYFSSMFVHAGLLHLANNLVMFYVFASIIEPKIGTLRFTLLLLMSGILSGAISSQFNDAVNVGASGAIFGLIGWALSHSAFSKPDPDKKLLLYLGALLGGTSLLFGFLTPNVNNMAHVIGLVCGFIFGFLMKPVSNAVK